VKSAELLQWLPAHAIDVLVGSHDPAIGWGRSWPTSSFYLLRLSEVIGVDFAAEAVKKLTRACLADLDGRVR